MHRRGGPPLGVLANIRPCAALEELGDHPHAVVLHTLRVLRCLQLWCSEPADRRIGLFRSEGLNELETDILLSAYDHDIRLPLAVIVAAMGPTPEMAERLAWACLAAGDWASWRNAPRVMLAFFFAAACCSASPSYRLVAELALVRYTLRVISDGDPENQRPDLLAQRRRLEAEIARSGGPAATREGLAIIRSGDSGAAAQRPSAGAERDPEVEESSCRHMAT